jgi:anti-sigma B factor antagonist
MDAPVSATSELEVTRHGHGAVTVIALAGELDMSTTLLLDEALENLDERGAIVLDLGDLTFIDSHGLRAIFGYAATRELILARPHPHVARVLALTKSDRVLRIEDTLEASLATRNGGPP